MNPITSIGTDTEVLLPVGEHYRPHITFETDATIKNIKDMDYVSDQITIEVDKFYISEQFINNEIADEERLNRVDKTRLNDLVSLKKQANKWLYPNNRYITT